jgi:hypothetical protein
MNLTPGGDARDAGTGIARSRLGQRFVGRSVHRDELVLPVPPPLIFGSIIGIAVAASLIELRRYDERHSGRKRT